MIRWAIPFWGLPIFYTPKSGSMFRKPYKLVFQATVLILLLSLLYFELTKQKNLPEIWASFKSQLTNANLIWLFLALALMPFNWLAESQKWRVFICRFEPMSQWKALQAVCAGVAVSLFTPNRIGAYGGRILFVQPENRWKAVVATLVGNFAQMLVLFSMGMLGLIWLAAYFKYLEPGYLKGFALAALAILVLLYWIYFNAGHFLLGAQRYWLFRAIKRFVKDWEATKYLKPSALGLILSWASLRYLIYATQYYCLLNFFDLKTGLILGYSGISTLFLLQTSLPLPPLTGLAARGNLAVLMWGQFGANEISSLAATFALWIINLILPTLVGTFSILYVNIAKTFVYENDQH